MGRLGSQKLVYVDVWEKLLGRLRSSPPVSSWNDTDCWYPEHGVRPCPKQECKRGRSDVADGAGPVKGFEEKNETDAGAVPK